MFYQLFKFYSVEAEDECEMKRL